MNTALAQLGHGAARTLAALPGAALELSWVAAHAACYPWGLTEERRSRPVDHYRLADLPPLRRALLHADVAAAGTPILLVHGMVDNRSIFTVLRRALHRRGFGRIQAVNYSVFTGDVPRAAAALGRQVEELCAETGYEQVHLIGHSLGGIIGRWYVQRLGGDDRVHTLVTLGSPHEGTAAARLLPLPVTRQLRPDSAVMRALRQPAPGCRTRFLAFWSDLDQFMVPRGVARLEHPDLAARNVPLRGVGHLSLPIDRRVVHEIVTTLAHLRPDRPQHPPRPALRPQRPAVPAARRLQSLTSGA